VEWHETGQVGGDQLVCDEIDIYGQGWISLETRLSQRGGGGGGGGEAPVAGDSSSASVW
jgi:hypothetical protein